MIPLPPTISIYRSSPYLTIMMCVCLRDLDVRWPWVLININTIHSKIGAPFPSSIISFFNCRKVGYIFLLRWSNQNIWTLTPLYKIERLQYSLLFFLLKSQGGNLLQYINNILYYKTLHGRKMRNERPDYSILKEHTEFHPIDWILSEWENIQCLLKTYTVWWKWIATLYSRYTSPSPI